MRNLCSAGRRRSVVVGDEDGGGIGEQRGGEDVPRLGDTARERADKGDLMSDRPVPAVDEDDG